MTHESTDLGLLRAAIAGSPIVVSHPGSVPRDFAGWCAMREPADIDGVILAWIRSHVPARKPSSLS